MKKAIQMIKNGASVKEAVRSYGVPDTSLRDNLRRLGIQSKAQRAWHFNFSQKENIRNLRKQGFSYSKIANQTKVPEHAIANWCSDILLTDEQNKFNLGAKIEEKTKAIVLRKQGKYISEIANQLKCSKSTIKEWIADHVSHTGEDISEKARLRKKQEDIKKCGSYKVNLQKIVALRKEGLSLKEIAIKYEVSPYVIKVALKQHPFSSEEIKEIEKKSILRLRERRASGEIKACGGIRENSGRSKWGYYKGIYCGSTYELCWAAYALDHDIKFSRFPDALKKGGITYIPDFLLADGKTIIELKGYEHEGAVAKKTAVAESYGYTVKVLRKSDLKFAFEHIKKYGVTPETCYTLYDGYKPKYDLVCGHCQKTFQRDHKYSKNCVEKVVFCSKSCSGKYRLAKNKEMGVKTRRLNQSQHSRPSKFSNEQIISVFNDKRTYKQISKEYGMHVSMVGFIKNKKVHKEILKDL